MIKRCGHCKQRFETRRRHAQHCSPRCRMAASRKRRVAVSHNDWHSPPEIVEAARQAMGGIDLDPASCAAANEIVQAATFYSATDDGLKQPWHGRVWLNPPYARLAPRFVQRFVEQFSGGRIEQGVLLLGTHHMTTDWFAPLWALDPIACMPAKRLQFSGSTARPAHGSVLLGVGVDPARFTFAFGGIGQLLRL